LSGICVTPSFESLVGSSDMSGVCAVPVVTSIG
jgi:hypothetical protein